MIDRKPMAGGAFHVVGNPEEARAEMVTASEAPAIAGISARDTPLQVWCRKKGYLPPITSRPWMEWGNRLQGAIIEAMDAEPNDRLYVMANDPIGATPDGFGLDSTIVEVKNTRWHVGHILAHASVQVQCQMMVTGYERARIGVLIGGSDLRVFDVARNDRFIGWLRARMLRFVQRLKENVPPEPRATDQKALEALYPEPSQPGVVMLPDEAVAVDAEIRRLKERAKADKEKIAELSNQIRMMVGEHRDGILPTGGRWRWGLTERKAFTVDAKSYRTLTRAKR